MDPGSRSATSDESRAPRDVGTGTSRDEWGTRAAVLFVGTALVLAIAVGAMLVAGWSGGRLDNRIEPLFWAGGILTALGTASFGLAAVPWTRPARRPGARSAGSDAPHAPEPVGTGTWRLRVGMILFLVGPVLAATAVFGDNWI